MRSLRKRRASKSRRRSCFLKGSSPDRKNFFARVWPRLKIWTEPVPLEIRINGDLIKQTQSGLVYDTLFRQGEWVAAGKPVVVLLPPQNIKVRAFIPETRVGSIHYGNIARVKVDGVKDSFVGKVSYISPRAEYTPPVIYSRETRAKLVFMVELIFDAQAAANLHPGQPVDVEFEPK